MILVLVLPSLASFETVSGVPQHARRCSRWGAPGAYWRSPKRPTEPRHCGQRSVKPTSKNAAGKLNWWERCAGHVRSNREDRKAINPVGPAIVSQNRPLPTSTKPGRDKHFEVLRFNRSPRTPIGIRSIRAGGQSGMRVYGISLEDFPGLRKCPQLVAGIS